jgi:hypothetical protein
MSGAVMRYSPRGIRPMNRVTRIVEYAKSALPGSVVAERPECGTT